MHGDELYVADSRNHRIVVYSLAAVALADYRPVRYFGGGESETRGRFGQPSGVCIANDKLYVTELSNQRVQVLTLDRGLPLQVLQADGPVSGVCADGEHLCTTSLDGDHAITLWRVQPPRTLRSDGGMSSSSNDSSSSSSSPTLFDTVCI